MDGNRGRLQPASLAGYAVFGLFSPFIIAATTAVAAPPVTMVLIDMEGVNYIDLEGSDMLNEIATSMKRVGVEIHLARVKREVMALLEKDGVDKNIGRNLIHSKVFEAVRWFTHKEKRVENKGQ